MNKTRQSAKRGFFGQWAGMSGHKPVEGVLQESKAALSAIFNIVGTGILIIDSETLTILEINQTAADIIGRSKAKIIGQICHSFVCPAEIGKCPIKDLGQSIDNSERKIICADGQRKDVLKNVSPLILNGKKCYLESFIDISERKKAEKALRESEEKHRVLIDTASDVIVILQDGIIKFANPRVATMFGYEPDEIEGADFASFIPQENLELTLERYRRRMAGEKLSEIYETVLLHKSGQKIPVELNGSIIEYEGKPADMAIIRDITERKRVEEQMGALANLLSSANVSITVHDADGGFIYANQATLDLHGYSRDEFMSLNLHELDDPETAKLIAPRIQQLTDKGETSFEVRHYRKDRSTFPLLVNARITEWDGKKAILSIASDITERKLAEEALKSSVSLLSASLESTADGILIVDRRGKITQWNQKFADMWKIPEEVLSTHDDDKAINHILSQLVAPEQFVSKVRILYGQPGESSFDQIEFLDGRVFERYSQPQKIEENIVGRVWSFRDITERKRAEENLIKSYETLKKTVNDAINTMVKIVEMRDPYTAGHQNKVADLAVAIARQMKLEDNRVAQLRTSAIVHDIGKMYVPSDLLSKPGQLTNEEFVLIKTHALGGYNIIKNMDFPSSVTNTVLQHHERLDGSGYPNQLKGEATLLEAKILAVADVVEAMSSHRPYRPALGIDKALEEISKNRGRLYDPDVVDACLELFKSGRFEFKPV